MKICYIYFKHDISRKSAVQLLLFFVVERRKLQCSGLTSKHSNSFVIVFIVGRLFLFFLFLRDKFWCFYHFLWAFWLKRKCTFHGNIYTNEKRNPFSNKICNFYVKKKTKKKYFNWLQDVIFPQFFSYFECKYVLIAFVYGKIK